MLKNVLDEREFELINIIGANLTSSQRDLSRHLDISLGMTNMLLRRMVSKGYIRINQLNKRKVQYLLTAKGFSEKMRKSIHYTLKTLNSIGLIKNRLKDIIQAHYDRGERNFYILGSSDLGILVENTVKEIAKGQHQIFFVHGIEEAKEDGLLCICKEGFETHYANGQKIINLITELAQRDLAAAAHA